jgi:hypothetical protein
MRLEDVLKIIEQEKLVGYNLFENRGNRENEIVIKKEEQDWIVYATDERASKVTGSEKTFLTEESALDNFIKRTRALNVLKKM